MGWRRNWIGLDLKRSAGSSPPDIIGEKTTTECRYFLSSFTEPGSMSRPPSASHWGIENQQHWVLDVQFGEDACRTRNNYSAENLALDPSDGLEHVLRHNGPSRDSIRRRKLRAALND
jgi:hypothetical protein